MKQGQTEQGMKEGIMDFKIYNLKTLRGPKKKRKRKKDSIITKINNTHC